MAEVTLPKVLVNGTLADANDVMEDLYALLAGINAVDATQVADASITEAKLAAGAVTNTKLGADAVDGTKIGDDVLNSEHYVAGSIDTEHLAASAVQGRYMGFSTTNIPVTTVHNEVLSGSGQEIVVAAAENVIIHACLGVSWASNATLIVECVRDSTQVNAETYSHNTDSGDSPQMVNLLWVDPAPGAGTYTYQVRAYEAGTGHMTISQATVLYTLDRGK